MTLLWGMPFTYIFVPLVLACALPVCPAAPHGEPGREKLDHLLFSLGAGPLAVAAHLQLLYFAFPHQTYQTYILLIVLPWLLPGLWLIYSRMRYLKLTRGALHMPSLMGFESHAACILILAAATVLVAGLYLPLKANDPVHYLRVASLAFQRGSFDFYPMKGPVDPSGFVVYMIHPLGYPAGILWHMILQRNGLEPGISKFFTLWYWCLLLFALCHAMRNLSPWSFAIGGLSLMLTPLLAYQAVSHGVDTLYLAPAFLLALLLSRNPRRGKDWLTTAVVSGILAGLTLRQHSAGAVTAFFVLAAYVLAGPTSLRLRARTAVAAGLIALLIGGERYLSNWGTLGHPMGDITDVWALKSLAREEFLQEKLGLASWYGKLANGLLMMWTRPLFYGLAPWTAVILAPFALAHGKDRPPLLRISLVFTCLFMAFNTVLVFSGCDTTIRGTRYFLPTIPFLALISAWGMETLVQRTRSYRTTSPGQGSGLGLYTLAGALLLVFIATMAVSFSIPSVFNSFIKHETNWFKKAASKPKSLERLVEVTHKKVSETGGRVFVVRMDRLARFTNTPYIRDIDKRLLVFYQAQSPEEAYGILKELNITHVMLTTDPSATTEHSMLRRILADLRYSRLIFRNMAGSLYQISTKWALEAGHVTGPLYIDLDTGSTCQKKRPKPHLIEMAKGETKKIRLPVPMALKGGPGILSLAFRWKGTGMIDLTLSCAHHQELSSGKPLGRNLLVFTPHGGAFGTQFFIPSSGEALELRIKALREVSCFASLACLKWLPLEGSPDRENSL